MKKGISTIVSAVIMIALVIAASSLVWTIVSNLLKDNMETDCFGNYDKVTINSRFTCFDYKNNEFRFSINIGDIDINEALIAITSNGNTNNFKLSANDFSDPNLRPNPGNYGDSVKLPIKNSGKAYVFNSSIGKVSAIQIAPIIGTKQCEVSDKLQEIDDCDLLVN